MSSSPRTPTRHHKTSSVDSAYKHASSPQPIEYSSPSDNLGQSSPQCEMSVPSSPLHNSPAGFRYDINVSDQGSGNGLGSLADELAEAWDNDCDEEANGPSAIQCETPVKTCSAEGSGLLIQGSRHVISAQSPGITDSSILSSSSRKSKQRSPQRRHASTYDDPDCGEEGVHEDADSSSKSFQACMAAIDALGQWLNEAYGSQDGDVIHRVAKSLKELPSQSGVENGATRLMTAYSALTTHLSYQTRSMLTLTHAILSPLSIPPDPDLIDELLPLLTSLFTMLPSPDARCLPSLHSLQTSTTDLQTTLTYLSDTIYMTRQTMTTGSRKLRIASELLLEMRREAEVQEEAVRWIDKGNWEYRLANRECASVCKDVVGGFEEVCEKWRERLVDAIGV